MTWEVVWPPRIAALLRRLPREAQVRILQTVMQSRDDPRRGWRRLTGRAGWRLRVGEYRVIADLDAARKRIVVTHVGHRRNVYK